VISKTLNSSVKIHSKLIPRPSLTSRRPYKNNSKVKKKKGNKSKLRKIRRSLRDKQPYLKMSLIRRSFLRIGSILT
jgi:hypothetical protein